MKITSVIVAGILTGVLFNSANAQSPQSQTERNKTLVLDFWREHWDPATKPTK